jgi:ABC-type proline/glycine betaine transport system permease subunit
LPVLKHCNGSLHAIQQVCQHALVSVAQAVEPGVKHTARETAADTVQPVLDALNTGANIQTARK